MGILICKAEGGLNKQLPKFCYGQLGWQHSGILLERKEMFKSTKRKAVCQKPQSQAIHNIHMQEEIIYAHKLKFF